jgi:magnesium chelatase subunit D
MNPEEGELRPQLRDRFALRTTVEGCTGLGDRVEVIERALGTHDTGPTDGADPSERLRRARELLPTVTLPEPFLEEIAELCRDAGVEGHRADIATARAARAFAALAGRPTVLESDVRDAAELALSHRMRSRPFEGAPDPGDLVEDRFDDADGSDQRDGDGTTGEEGDDADESAGNEAADDGNGTESAPRPADGAGDGNTDGVDGSDGAGDGRADPPSAGHAVDHETDTTADGDGTAGAEATAEEDGTEDGDSGAGGDETDRGGDRAAVPLVPGADRDGDGRTDVCETAGVGGGGAPELPVPEAEGTAAGRGRARDPAGTTGDGPRVRAERADRTDRIDPAASVRAAAGRGSTSLEDRDLRRSVRRDESTALVLFVVDASASMRPAMRAAKGTVLDLLRGSYRERDRVGFVSFAGADAEVLLPPTDSVALAARHLKELPTGDRTPLPAGLRTAATVLDRADPAAAVVVLVTDGRANVAEDGPVASTRSAARAVAERGAEVVVVDAGDDDRSGLVGTVVEATDGRRVPLDALSADRVDATVGVARETQVSE